MRAARLALLTLAALPAALAGACGEEVGVNCEANPNQPACQMGDGDGDGEHLPARLYVDPPFGLGFDCVAPGCDATRSFTLENRGTDPVHITTVRLSVATTSEMTLQLARASNGGPAQVAELPNPTEESPLVLGPDDVVEAIVRYRPDDAVADEGALWVDWYDGTIAPDEAVIERVELPITTRVLGDAEAELLTPSLDFGYVPVGQTVVLPVEIRNATSGTAVLALSPAEVSAGAQGTYRVLDPRTLYVEPGETASFDVAFTPSANTAFFGQLAIPTNDGARPTLGVALTGTAVEQPFFKLVEPDDWTVDFGDARIGDTRTREIAIQNLGGLPLVVIPHMEFGADVGFAATVPFGQSLPAVMPLSEVRFTVSLSPAVGGELLGKINFQTNDPTLPYDWVDLEGYGVAPDAEISADVLDFGQLVQSWTSPAQTVTIRNRGTGEMTVSLIEFEVGSSSQVHIAEMPQLPVKLTGDDAIELAVYVQGQVIGPANAAILVHTDSIEEPVRRIDVLAEVVGCDEGCPMAGGTPSCASGSCQVGVCFQGLHDADGAFSTGCECGEDTASGDVGGGCFEGVNVGPLGDDGQGDYQNSTSRSGTLHAMDDVDLYYFYAVDGGGLSDAFGDSFGIKVELTGAPPGLMFCYRYADDGCGGQNQRSCGWTSRSFAGGSYGSDDNTWVTVWVEWQPGSNPVCGNYNISFRADDG